jgi:prevent-host-death family protein
VLEISVKELRSELRRIIDQVETGEEVTITRRGKVVARLMPPQREPQEFPDLTEFRASIQLKGDTPLDTLLTIREESR